MCSCKSCLLQTAWVESVIGQAARHLGKKLRDDANTSVSELPAYGLSTAETTIEQTGTPLCIRLIQHRDSAVCATCCSWQGVFSGKRNAAHVQIICYIFFFSSFPELFRPTSWGVASTRVIVRTQKYTAFRCNEAM